MKILLVSDNRDDWQLIRAQVKKNFSDVELMCAASGGEAMNIVSFDGPFGFFILDVEMKNEEPAELLENLIELSGDRPTLFLGSEAFIKDRIPNEVYISNDHNDIIPKPIEPEVFVEKVKFALEWTKEEEFETNLEEINPEDFVPMKLKSFFLYKSFGYDIYMEVTPTRYIKIIEAAKPYSFTFLSNYSKKGVKMLYIKKDDQLMYLENESNRCIKALNKFTYKDKEIFLAQLKSINIFHLYYNTIGMTPTVVTLFERLVDSINDTFQGQTPFRDVISRYPTNYDGTASKSLLTAYICEALSKGKEWDSSMTRKKLVASAILQDISIPDEGMTHISKINDERLELYQEDALEKFRDHPLKAAEVALHFSNFPDLDFILIHHHELPNRHGFPNRPSNSKLTALCSVFNIAQYIAAEIDGKKLDKSSIPQLLKTMTDDFSAGYFKETLKGAPEWLSLD